MNKPLRWLAGGLAVLLLPVVYNLDAIAGKWRLGQLCKAEGATHAFEKLDKDAGWFVAEPPDHSYRYGPVFDLGHVAFVRWQTLQGETVDVFLDPGYAQRPYPKDPASRFVVRPVDPTRTVRYQWRFRRTNLDDPRFSRSDQEIIDLRSGRVIVSFTDFNFQWTKPERVILSAPTGQSCAFTEQDYRHFLASLYSN